MKLPPMVRVTWWDACSGGTDWVRPDKAPMEVKQSHTVGFLVRKDKVKIVVALNWDGVEYVSDMIAIPLVNVIKVKRLR